MTKPKNITNEQNMALMCKREKGYPVSLVCKRCRKKRWCSIIYALRLNDNTDWLCDRCKEMDAEEARVEQVVIAESSSHEQA